VAAALLVAGACTYDFEAPFAETPVGGGAPGGGGGAEGGGGASTSTSGTGGQSGGENCGNGTDDDGDDDIDCADADCSGFTCVPPPPEDWSYGAVAVVTAGDSLPDCLAGWPTASDAQAGLLADPAQCDCSCGSPTVTCTLAATVYFDSASCSNWGPQENWTPSSNGACDQLGAVSFSDPNDGLEAEPVSVASASCDAIDGNHAVPPTAWSYAARICADPPEGGGCEGSDVCVPTTAAPFTTCIHRSGDQDCPAPFDDKTLLFGGVDDQRGCDCSCGAPSGASCTAQTAIHGWSTSCQGSSPFTLTHDGSCQGVVGPFAGGSMQYTATPSGGPCPVNAQPAGEASGTQPRTVCCLP